VLFLITLGVASYVAVAVPLAVIIGRSIKAGLGDDGWCDQPQSPRLPTVTNAMIQPATQIGRVCQSSASVTSQPKVAIYRLDRE
jgi:hypothetical protein